MDAPPVQYVTTSDGYSIAYAVSGEGEPFVFMPLPFNHIRLNRQPPSVLRGWLSELEKRFRLICYDSRGQGMSTRGLPEGHSPDVYVVDLETVIARLQPGPMVLFGAVISAHSAIRYAVKHPDRVLALVLWNATPTTAAGPLSHRLDISAPEDWRFFLQTAARTAFGGSYDPAAVLPFYEAAITQQDFIRRRNALRDSSVEREAPLLRVPTLLLAGPHAGVAVAAGEASQRLAALIPDSRLVLFDDPSGGIVSSSEAPPAAILAIEAFLEEVAGSRRTPAPPGDLSAREIEVLRLLAAGRSNPQIAGELVISLNTVQHHVSNILTKTGCANRTEAAAYAHRHALV